MFASDSSSPAIRSLDRCLLLEQSETRVHDDVILALPRDANNTARAMSFYITDLLPFYDAEAV